MKQSDKALLDYAKAISISTDDRQTSRALNNRAALNHDLEKYENAIADYTQAISIYPGYDLYYNN